MSKLPCLCCQARRVLYFLTSVWLYPTQSKNSFTIASSISCRIDSKLFFQSFSLWSSAIEGIFEEEMSTFTSRTPFESSSVFDVEMPNALQTTLMSAFFPKLFSMSTPKFLQICFSLTFPNIDTSLNDFKFVVRRKSSSLAAMLVFLTQPYPPRRQALWDREKRELSSLNSKPSRFTVGDFP